MSAPGLSVVMLRSLAELLRRLDLDAAGFLAALDIDERTTPDTYVDGELVDRLLALRAAKRGCPTLALELAATSLARPFGPFGHLVWHSATVREALERAIRFYAVVTRRATLELVEIDGGLFALRQRVVPGFEYGFLITEFAFAACALWARAATEGAFTARRMSFVHAIAPGTRPRYEQLFGAPVEDEALHNELVMDAAALALPLATSEPIVVSSLEGRVAELASTSKRTAFIDRVRRAIASELAAELTHATVARRLGISARTLRRRLDAEACTLRALVDDVRRERTDELVRAGVSIKEIAFTLGFSEPSALSRAYKRWTGKPPTTQARRTRS